MTLLVVMFVLAEHAFVVGLSGAENVKENASDLVCGRSDGLRSTQTAGDSTVELTKIVVSVMQ